MEETNIVYGRLKDMVMSDEGAENPLRLDDLFKFLNERRRSTECPHCDHGGAWEVAMIAFDDQEANPVLQLFKTPIVSGSVHTSVGLTCPNCGHFAQINTYKIRQFLAGEEKPTWVK